MTNEKWEETLRLIKEKFSVKSQSKEKIEDGGEKEIVEFQGPLGLMRLEWLVKPKTLGFKTLYSKRARTAAKQVKPVLSSEEKVSFVKAYVWKDERWVEIEKPF
jgi:hypothetical protein